jgi:hypothetical protein
VFRMHLAKSRDRKLEQLPNLKRFQSPRRPLIQIGATSAYLFGIPRPGSNLRSPPPLASLHVSRSFSTDDVAVQTERATISSYV